MQRTTGEDLIQFPWASLPVSVATFWPKSDLSASPPQPMRKSSSILGRFR